MKIKTTLPVMVSSAVLLAACGGGGSNTTTTPIATSFKLTGTVPGTLIEAFCDDGSYHKVNSTTNSTDKHPFELNLPKNLSCRLVMTINENDPVNKVITPIAIKANGVSNIAFRSNADINIGHVDLPLEINSEHPDNNGDRVVDSPKVVLLDAVTASNVSVIISDNDPFDDDNDGIINIYEDDDNDGINNRDDDDDDNDGINDIDDNDRDNDNINDNDLDGDGISNDRDVDDDNDGLHDDDDNDDDNDGIDDNLDNDDDNDGVDDRDDNDNDRNTGTDDNRLTVRTAKNFSLPVNYSADATGGRLLSAQCAQCHGTNGYSIGGIDSLARELYELSEEMAEYRGKTNNHIMNAQAKAYTINEVNAMYNYLLPIVTQLGTSNDRN